MSNGESRSVELAQLCDERDALLRQKDEYLSTMRRLREDVETQRDLARRWKASYITARSALILVMEAFDATLADFYPAERALIAPILNDGDGAVPSGEQAMDTIIEQGDVLLLFHRALDDEERRQINDVLRRLIKAEDRVEMLETKIAEALDCIDATPCRAKNRLQEAIVEVTG